MPEPLFKALCVWTGLLLLGELGSLLPQTRSAALRALLHAGMGLVSLLAGNVLGGHFGLRIGLNVMTLPVSLVLGAPGTALLWAARYLL